MKLFIPPLGTMVKTAADWSFTLHDERRNDGFVEAAVPRKTKRVSYYDKISYPVTLPAGAVLKVERVFIRRGISDFDSVTFILQGKKHPIELANGRAIKANKRFWVKLPDANQIDVASFEVADQQA